MTVRLKEKKALVTASGQGIGRATALAFAAEGAEVIATDINRELLSRLERDAPGITVAIMDVTSTEQVEAVRDSHPRIDILFNCAGIVPHGSIEQSSESELRGLFDINVVSMYRTIAAWLPGMLARESGCIVNMSSVASSVSGAPDRFAYGTTKAAVIGLTKSVAADYVERGVRCNAICPGTVQTPSLNERIDAFDDPEAARAAFIARQPMGRLGTPEEVAALACYLASDEAAFTTGTIHIIDGGWSN